MRLRLLLALLALLLVGPVHARTSAIWSSSGSPACAAPAEHASRSALKHREIRLRVRVMPSPPGRPRQLPRL